MGKDPQSRRWQITINNADTKGYSHECIKTIIESKFPSALYWCMADEIGDCFHTHIYIVFSGGVRFSTLQNAFDKEAHLEAAYGSNQKNKDYITKSGEWLNDAEKQKTVIKGTFEEWGEMPVDRRGKRDVSAEIIERIQDGASNAEIILEFPECLRSLRDIDYVRQTLRAEEYRNKWRDLHTIYIWGPTEAGKTRFVMDGCGYENVCAINNYDTKFPFDNYRGESVVLFDEFDSDIKLQAMNRYLDGYPIALPAKYSDRQACYERVFIISNLDLFDQYTREQEKQPAVWAAFLRRIHKVIRFMPDGSRREYATPEYMAGSDDIAEASPEEQLTISELFPDTEDKPY